MLNFMVNAEGGLTQDMQFVLCWESLYLVLHCFLPVKIQKKIKCPRNSLRAVRWQWHLLLLLPISRFSLCHGAAV